jgi:uncharacterized membrane protein YkvA (DUF1232 family)
MMAVRQRNIFARLIAMASHTVAVFTTRQTPFYVKLLLASGLIYVISPWDLIPEWVPVVGVLDDFGLAALLIAWANSVCFSDKG